MRRGSTLLVAVLAGAGLTGSAAAFDWQVEGGYVVTSGGNLTEDVNLTTAVADYYFSGVSDDRNPYDLQPFFQKAPYGQVMYGALEAGPADMQVLDVNAELFMASPVRGLSFRPHFVHYTTEITGLGSSTVNVWELDIGYYFLDELKVSLPGFITGYVDPDQGDTVEEDLSFKDVRIECVAGVNRQNIAIQVDYGWDPDGEMTNFNVEVRYYPTRDVGVGVRLNNNPDGLTSVFLDAGYWVGPTMRLAVEFGMYTDDSAYGDASSMGISFAARF